MLRSSVVLAASMAALTAGSTSTNEWHACPLFSSVGNATHYTAYFSPPPYADLAVECLNLQVPLCYPGVCTSKKTISIFLKRIPATRPTTPGKAVWLLQGGPGSPSQGMEGYMASVYTTANGSMSLYTMDHRGVGRSSALSASCPEIRVLDGKDGDSAVISNCFQKLKDTYGHEAPKGFSVTSAGTDLAALIESPLLAADDVFVYGASYGTYLAERLMHLAPKNVKGYILDGIVSESPVSMFSAWDRDVANVEKTYYGFCDKDPICGSKIGPNSQQFAFDLFAKLDANDTACAQAIYAAKGLPSDFVGSALREMVISYWQRNMIPSVLYRLAKCVVDVKSETRFLKGLLGLPIEDSDEEYEANETDVVPGDKVTGNAAMDTLLYFNIAMNELWELPSPSYDRLEVDANKISWSTTAFATTYKLMWLCLVRNMDDPVCEDNGWTKQKQAFAYDRDMYWNKTAAVPAGASVLMLTGGLDIQTKPDYAVAEFNSMAGSNKLSLLFPTGGHGITATTPTNSLGETCGIDILNMYLQSDGNLSAIDTRCMANVLPLDFTTILDRKKSKQLFGNTTDMFGDAIKAAVKSQVDSQEADDVDAKHKMEMMALSGGMIACVFAVLGMALYVKKVKRDLKTAPASVVEPEGVVDAAKEVTITSEVAIV
ncbi:hypothetical protein SDRG_00346 [Saprolegnia diclina VS20]|uniref:AB hydrolase-1 domain-containing protein n=1 Tax=Saprolegnia diclina (strain VS20) TaxID=1156394 RepID=T0SIB5_SAPDV|nr:hypothetical protein SDRG_00346 [Saprolegnia diclina VS20]EQC42617.1 hypothetical protein SDRG_00346 [Saprolegnia diclina VS20]|eukprot:XP_008604040.1 hypothetical protein SDRG_00346 [Saprolegnia diclina VS20]